LSLALHAWNIEHCVGSYREIGGHQRNLWGRKQSSLHNVSMAGELRWLVMPVKHYLPSDNHGSGS